MTSIEKGYVCPDLPDCTECQFFKNECIVYGKEGKKKFKEWIKRNNLNPNTLQPLKKKQEEQNENNFKGFEN